MSQKNCEGMDKLHFIDSGEGAMLDSEQWDRLISSSCLRL